MDQLGASSQAIGHSRIAADGHVVYEPLAEHLKQVSELAEQFADKFQAANWGRALGRWHDLGKYSAEFQSYLRGSSAADGHQAEQADKVDHSTAGAKHALEHDSVHLASRRTLAYCIAGHHAGLTNASAQLKLTPLQRRLSKQVDPWHQFAPADLLVLDKLDVPTQVQRTVQSFIPGGVIKSHTLASQRATFSWAMFTRMLFSCLVDADFIATEQFMTPQAAVDRTASRYQLGDLLPFVSQRLAEISAIKPAKESRSFAVYESRQQVLNACIEAAKNVPGFFSLTVPTGGGKTLASLRFALEHVAANESHRFQRVVFAIPFTSIIEQTADVYRRVFADVGDDVVLEHHSNLPQERETTRSRLAAQNYDSPIVVTTNVQLFESLFANRTSQCRKLHNLVRSVVVLDEVQTLPVELLQPTLCALQELVDTYGCTIVLCTATQPSLHWRDEFPIGIQGVREIIPPELDLATKLKRVDVHWLGELSPEQLTTRLASHRQFLCIHNTRRDTSNTFKSLRAMGVADDLFHLSTFMCPQHRREAIQRIRERLKDQLACRVVSTQLIEAGVDVDFPVVYRAIAGIDSIAQSAGRCNREGKLDRGQTYVFATPKQLPAGMLSSTASTTRSLLPLHSSDLISPAAVYDYFRMHYWRHTDDWDKRQIMPMHSNLMKCEVDFDSIANAYQFIEDTTFSVVVPYGQQGRDWCQRLRETKPEIAPLSRGDRQSIQQYSVSLYREPVLKGLGRDFELVYGGQYIVLASESLYDKDIGIDLTKTGWLDPEQSVI